MPKRKPIPKRIKLERDAAARVSRILRLVQDGFSYEEIGRMLEPKISRQRVGQIVKAATPA
jgi:uncharacterized protein YjhX (UPF0386 family)